MDWTRLPKEDIIYIDHDEWVVENPVSTVGTLYIEKETKRCKIGDGRRYNDIPYTPWSISTDVSTVVEVKNIVTSTTGLDQSEKYIWNASTRFGRGYFIEYINGIWAQSIPTDNSFAWVKDLYQLEFWDGSAWHDVDVNTHNKQFSLEGGEGGHYYHLGEKDYNNVTRLTWRYPVNEVLAGSFPTGVAVGYRVAISEATPEGNDTYDYIGYIFEYNGSQWIPEDVVDGQTVVNLTDSAIYTWNNYRWNKAEGGGGGSGAGIKALTPVNRNCLLVWNDNYGLYAKDANVGAYVKDCLFVRHPYGMRNAEYKAYTYASGDTETYAGIVGIENGVLGYTCDGIHPRVGFTANVFSKVKASEFGGGMVIFGCCDPNNLSRVSLIVKPLNSTEPIEVLKILNDHKVTGMFGMNVPTGFTYDVNGVPHGHDATYLKLSGGTMLGDINMGGNRVVNADDPINAGDLVTLNYLSGLLSGVAWQKPVNAIVATPPTSDGRYLIAAEGTSGVFIGHENQIATRTGGLWSFVAPQNNWGVNNKDDTYNYVYNGTDWIQMQAATSHTTLMNLASDDHLQYVHLYNARTIVAQHSFTATGQPFLVTSNVMVENFNANFLQGHPASYFATADHEHELDWVELGGFSITDPKEGDSFYFDATAEKFINKSLNLVAVYKDHIFDTNNECDNYFLLHMDELTTGTFASIAGVLYLYTGSLSVYDAAGWRDVTTIMRGTDGRDGIDGDVGPQGPKGETGAPGSQGPQGIQGPPGTPGTSIDLKGSVATVAGLPTSGNEVHDAYYCEADGDCWMWSEDSTWVNVGPIVGPQGLQGIQGIQGPRGEKGSTGERGPQGIPGDTGPKGDTGERGPEGSGDPAWQSPVEAIVNSPPSNYDNNDRFIVGESPTGAFENNANHVATFVESDPPGSGSWVFEIPYLGWTAYVNAQNCHYSYGATGWAKIQGSGGGEGTFDHSVLLNRDAAEAHPASSITLDVSKFNKNLGPSDDTVQLAIEKLDDLVSSINASGFLGWFEDEASLVAAFPSAAAGSYAFVYDTDTIWAWNANTSVWANTYRKSNTLEPLDPMSNCLTAWNDDQGAYLKSASQGAFVENGLFVKVPHSTGSGKYKVKTYGDTYTESYAGIVDLTTYLSGYYKNYPGVGFVCNMIDGVNTARFGGGLIISGHEYSYGYYTTTTLAPYLALAIKPANSNVIEVLKVGNDGYVHCSPGIVAATMNIPSGQTYNVGGVPHKHDDAYLKLVGGTLTGSINLSGNRILNVSAPVDGSDAVNKDYVAGLIVGTVWQTSVEGIITAPPIPPVIGNRYIVSPDATGVFVTHENQIATWDGVMWKYETPSVGWCVSNKSDNFAYNFNGSGWAQLPGAQTHNALLGLGSDDHSQYVHVTMPRTITALHTFSRTGAPFNVTSTVLVSNLNVEYLNGIRGTGYALFSHTHGLNAISDVSLSNLQNGQILVYDSTTQKFINAANESGSGALAMNPNHEFANTTERDAYFAAHPSELEQGTFIAVGTGFQQYDDGVWVDRTAVVRGPAGTNGTDGKDGVNGSQGIQGPKGDQGIQGIQGPAGTPGTSINIVGAIETQADLPVSASNFGDAYYCRADTTCWVWTESGWVDVGLITGPQGIQGIQGPQGIKGDTGEVGPTGPMGPTGPKGDTGNIGPRGPSGYDNPYYQPAVEGVFTNPPEVYDYGDRFIVASPATVGSVFEGHDNQIATWMETNQWYFESAVVGWAAYDMFAKVHRVWNGSTWVRWESTGATWGAINGVIDTQLDLKGELDSKLDTTDVGIANGVAGLDENGKILATQLPSFVDDVLEYDTVTLFPVTGESGKIYVALDTDKTYRWSGSQYTEIVSGGTTIGETSTTAYRGDRGKIAYDHSQVAHAPSDAEKNVQSDWNEIDPLVDSFIKNKPSIGGIVLSKGSATITTGNKTVVVTHGAGGTPEHIEVVPDCIISAVGSTTFTISMLYTQPVDVVFKWMITPMYTSLEVIDGGTP